MASWLKHIRNWSEVRRVIYLTVAISGSVWFIMDQRFRDKVDSNLKEVQWEQEVSNFSKKLDGVISAQEDLKLGQDSLCKKFIEFEKDEAEKYDMLKLQMNKNHEAFMYSLEFQGTINRDALMRAAEKISSAEKKSLDYRWDMAP